MQQLIQHFTAVALTRIQSHDDMSMTTKSTNTTPAAAWRLYPKKAHTQQQPQSSSADTLFPSAGLWITVVWGSWFRRTNSRKKGWCRTKWVRKSLWQKSILKERKNKDKGKTDILRGKEVGSKTEYWATTTDTRVVKKIAILTIPCQVNYIKYFTTNDHVLPNTDDNMNTMEIIRKQMYVS